MEIIDCGDVAQWESWLAEHGADEPGVWLKIAKKGAGRASITIKEALDGALCYGWIDSQRKSFDESYYLQKYSPRRPGGSWSQVNVGKAEALIAAGRMRAGGEAEIAAAKADGRWEAAYESQRNASVPPDLAAALEDSERAGRRFAELAKTERYLIILGLLKARTPATRATRLRRAIAALEEDRS
jgi:uncharacterized protein YdeI (YjbR/CyaY-like superfamily)